MISADPSAALVVTRRRADQARIEPRELLEIFDDPYAALAAAVVVLPMQKGKWCEVARNDNSRFLASKWFSLICGALDLDEHNWREMLRE